MQQGKVQNQQKAVVTMVTERRHHGYCLQHPFRHQPRQQAQSTLTDSNHADRLSPP